jgi:RNA polymerase sigma-70 factor, ECF subfamily
VNAEIRSDDEWLSQLTLPAPGCNSAIIDLGKFLRRGLVSVLRKHGQIDEDTAEDFVQEAVIRIIDKLDTYKGNARFTTWAMKVAVNMSLSELRRRRWREVSLDDFEYSQPLYRESKFNRILDGPEKKAMKGAFFSVFNKILMNRLSAKQRKVMTAVMLYGMPMEEVAQRIGSNRNAIYKLMHDARKKIRSAFEEEGIGQDDVHELFS